MSQTIPHIPYPVSLATVDIAIYNYDKGVLLGKKANSDKLRFIGGFCEPGESHETSAKRETKEECGLDISDELLTGQDMNKMLKMEYLGSYFIDDDRYKNSPHKITTSFYKVMVDKKSKPKAGDDIVEVEWVPIEHLWKHYKEIVHPNHIILMEILFKNF